MAPITNNKVSTLCGAIFTHLRLSYSELTINQAKRKVKNEMLMTAKVMCSV